MLEPGQEPRGRCTLRLRELWQRLCPTRIPAIDPGWTVPLRLGVRRGWDSSRCLFGNHAPLACATLPFERTHLEPRRLSPNHRNSKPINLADRDGWMGLLYTSLKWAI